jgi:hypothetical protein
MSRVYFLHLNAGLNDSNVGDYQLDTLMHGMCSIDVEVHTNLRWWWLLTEEKDKNPSRFTKLWGRGFSSSGILDEHPKIVTNPIKTKRGELDTVYDLCIIGIHHTLNGLPNEAKANVVRTAQLNVLADKYAIIDGHDFPHMPQDDFGPDTTYFKRELTVENEERAKPISFAFPERKILKPDLLNYFKKRDIAPLIPVCQNVNPDYMKTYVYDDEKSYYDMYQTSVLALTSKKGGWDTMRHLEILANRCIPIFVDLELCPQSTLWNFPKDLCFLARQYVDLNLTDGSTYDPMAPLPHCGVVKIGDPGKIKNPTEKRMAEIFEIQKQLFRYFKENLLTSCLAKYVLKESLKG